MSLIDLFSAVEVFKNSKYDSATYDLNTNSFSFWLKGELDGSNTERLQKLIEHRRAMVGKMSIGVAKYAVVEIDNLISQFPRGVFKLVTTSRFHPNLI